MIIIVEEGDQGLCFYMWIVKWGTVGQFRHLLNNNNSKMSGPVLWACMYIVLLNSDNNSVIPIFNWKKLRREQFDQSHISSKYGSLILKPGLSDFLLGADNYGNNSAN